MRLLAAAASGLAALASLPLAAGGLPSDTPAKFVRDTTSFDYITREVQIPMRDGVKLETVILIPKGARAVPMLLTRTPCDALHRVHSASTHLASAAPQMDDTAVASGYIIVLQDVRGKHGSGGDYVMTRPLRGPLNPTAVDPATDAYDTIDWLVKHVPESNGRVGTIGGSYDGFTALPSTLHPHPALKVSIAFSPMVDTWVGDDSFHNGAFRQAVVLGVVKLIDVWPEDFASQPELSGYQLMISADIFRGRYRADRTRGQPIPANQALLYRFRLPNASHTFLPGHRVMVQIQSSWFPLYDRNPQQFVPNIMFAAPRDYIKTQQRIWHDPGHASAIELPVIPGAASSP